MRGIETRTLLLKDSRGKMEEYEERSSEAAQISVTAWVSQDIAPAIGWTA